VTVGRSVAEPPAGPVAAVGRSREVERRPTVTDEPATPSRRRGEGGHRGLCVFLLFAGVAALVLRRPDVLMSPKLWAEDGAIFMKDAYLRPVYKTVFTPYSGYVLVVPRLWAALTTTLPVRFLPLSYALFTLFLDAACLAVVLSKRFAWMIPSFAVRAVLFASLILIPGTWEINGNLTNSIWYTGLCLLLLSFATDPESTVGKAAEVVVVLLFALTGAMSLVVAPLFALRWWRTRSWHSALVTLVVGGAALFQFVDLRLHPRVGAQLSSTTIVDWARTMVERVGATGALGQRRLAAWWPGPHHHEAALALGVALLAGTFALGWFLPSKARLPLAVAMVLLLASITVGVVGSFRQLNDPGFGGRYFVTPVALLCLALAASVPVARHRLPKPATWAAFIPVAILALGTVGDARLTALPPIGWPQSARCIASHQTCHVPLDPPGWFVDLPPLRSVH
jgi:hypothetical protein